MPPIRLMVFNPMVNPFPQWLNAILDPMVKCNGSIHFVIP